MRDPQVRLTNISIEIDRGGAHDMVGNPTGVSELAACLFDLRSAHEAELRTLTWIQKTLECLRAGRECGDADLLLREMARLIKESEGTAANMAGHRRSARRDSEQSRRQPPRPRLSGSGRTARVQ